MGKDVEYITTTVVTDKGQDLFFNLLTCTHSYAELERTVKDKFGLEKFQNILKAYLQCISNKLDDLDPALSDEQHLGFVDWMLLQGHDNIQLFLNVPNVSSFRASTTYWENGQLRQAKGHWMVR